MALALALESDSLIFLDFLSLIFLWNNNDLFKNFLDPHFFGICDYLSLVSCLETLDFENGRKSLFSHVLLPIKLSQILSQIPTPTFWTIFAKVFKSAPCCDFTGVFYRDIFDILRVCDIKATAAVLRWIHEALVCWALVGILDDADWEAEHFLPDLKILFFY